MPCPATRQQEARAIVRTAAPIASAAALTAQPLAACPLRVASALQVGNDCSTFCAASPPSLSLRGGRRPTWQSRSIRLNRGKAIGEIATAFPRLHPKGTSSRFALRAPRPRWGLAMTNLGALRHRSNAADTASSPANGRGACFCACLPFTFPSVSRWRSRRGCRPPY